MTEAQFQHRRHGFTLIELLTVIAIVAVLAGLLGTAVSGARNRSRQAQCLNNVRQLGVALNSFVSQQGAYPLYANPQLVQGLHADHGSTWFSALSREADIRPVGAPGRTDRTLSSGIWDCPSARKPADWRPEEGYSDYGYNAYGVGDHTPGNSFGLGGQVTGPDARRPLKESEVAAPSSTYALGDGLRGDGQEVADGLAVLGRHRLTAPRPGDSERVARRHSGKALVGFCDGHVDAVSLEALFAEQTDEALSRWNHDHQPHRDRLNL